MNRGCERVGDAVGELFRAASGRSVFLDHPLQRRFQDIQAGLGHAFLGPDPSPRPSAAPCSAPRSPSWSCERAMSPRTSPATASLVIENEVADVATESKQMFGPDLRSVYDNWAAFSDFAAGIATGTATLDPSRRRLPCPSHAKCTRSG